MLALANVARAQFTPIAINPTSFNHDVVVEASAAIPLNGAVNATVDGGTNRTGNTWYEVGYNPLAPTTGLPVAGSLLATNNYAFRMPPDYHVNNALMVGHHNGGRTVPVASGTLTLTTPAAFSGLSFLTTSGNGAVLVGYTIHYADATTEVGSPFTALDWFNGTAARIYNAAGRVSINGGGVQNVGANPGGVLFAADITVGNPAVNITSIDFSYAGFGNSGVTFANTNINGRAMIFAISGAKDGSADFTNTLALTGFNYDVVMEADGPPTTGSGVAAGSTLTNTVTATMDGGISKANNTWYEKGYYAGFPNSGFPTAGSTVNSATLPASYTLPGSYAANHAVFVSKDVTGASISFATPATYGGLSFLCAAANGDTFVPCTVRFQDGSIETNTLFIPDWFNRVLPPAYLAFGRVNPNNRTINNSPEQFVNPFQRTVPEFDFRFDLPPCRLFDAVINVTNTASAVTNISLSFTNGTSSTRVAAIFAVSGAAVGSVPPVFGASGTPTPGQPGNARLDRVSYVKALEGASRLVVSVTNIAGTGPISYQWKKAPRGGGLHDIYYTIDYNTFANVTDGGRISGATSSALVISNTTLADTSDYLVVASNPSGTITSLVATVMIVTTNQSILLGQPFGDVITPIAADSTPVAESLDHAIDRVAQKWLSSGLQNIPAACCPGVLPWVGPVGFVVTPVSGASFVTSMRFFTANDSQGRDPSDYTLEGSNDGSTWTPITGGAFRGTFSLPRDRNGTGTQDVDPLNRFCVEVDFANATSYKSYRVSITNNIDLLGNALMQIAEIELLGSFVPAPPTWVRQPGDPDDADVKVFVGASPSFVAQATGLGALAPKYQWYKNAGTLIAGATTSSYTLANAQLADSGTMFYCVATNGFGSITSTKATLTVIAAPTASYPAAVLADNPIGYWRLNEADNAAGNNGVTAHDYRGGRNGYYSNTVNALQGFSPALDPDTSADFGYLVLQNSYVANIKDVSFARATNAAGATFSVEAWAYGGNQGIDAAIVTKGYNGILNVGTGTGTEQFVLDVSGGNPRKFRFLVRDAAGQGYAVQSAVVPYDPATSQPTWRHLVGVCDQPNGKLYLYVDGLLAGSGTIVSNAGIQSQPLAMTIGSRQSSGATEYVQNWQGRIDDVAIYNSALSASQALNHYYAGQRPPVITLEPTSQTTPESVTVTFTSAAYGAGTVGYQWYLSDGTEPTNALAGANSANLSFLTTAAQSGLYFQVLATNQYGATTSAVAQLTVVSGAPTFTPSPPFVDLPSADTFLKGHVMQLRVVPGGTAPFTYQWQKGGVNLADNYRISGSQSNVLTIVCADLPDSGNYQVFVTGQGTTPSTMDAVTVTTGTIGVTAFNAAGTGWQMQGTVPAGQPAMPAMTANRLQLTEAAGNTVSSAFLSNRVSISSFIASFVYQDVTGAGGADGATFCLQNDPRGVTALGGGGGALGYSGITPSFALALNIYASNTRGINFLQGGILPAAGAGAYAPILPVGLGDNANPIQVNLTYSGGVLTSSFKDLVTASTFTTNITVDIPAAAGGALAYVGFTGADGGTVSTQVISNFTMSLPPVTLRYQKAGTSLLLAWPASAGACLQSTPALGSPSVWSDVTDSFRVVGNEVQVTVSTLVGTKFYRLVVYP